MQDNNIIGYFLLTEKFENFQFRHGINLSLFNLNINKLSSPCSLFLTIFNNYDFIIQTLENGKKLIKEPFWDVSNYIQEELAKCDKDFSQLLSQEINNCICTNNSNLSKLERSLKDTQLLIDESVKNNELEFVDDLKEDEKHILEDLSKVQNREKHLTTYIENLISYLSSYKSYFDLYFGITDNKNLKKKDVSFFQGLFNITFNIPKHQIYQAFIENNKIVLANSMMFSCYQKLKETNNTTLISDSEIYESIYNKTQKLNNADEFFTLRNYEISSIKDLLCIYFNYFVENKITINKCKNCGKYFIPLNRTDEKYCDNISPQKPNKTCKEYGVKKAYTDTIASNPIKTEHIRTSQFYRVKISRAKNKNDLAFANKLTKILAKYLIDYEKQIKKFEKNKISESEFVEWIIAQKQ